MGISYSEELTILVIRLRSTTKSELESWTRLTSLVRIQARQECIRDFNIAQRVTYVQVYMLAKLWYTAQVLQPPRVSPTNCVNHVVVYMEGCHISSAPINIAETQGGRWMGSD